MTPPFKQLLFISQTEADAAADPDGLSLCDAYLTSLRTGTTQPDVFFIRGDRRSGQIQPPAFVAGGYLSSQRGDETMEGSTEERSVIDTSICARIKCNLQAEERSAQSWESVGTTIGERHRTVVEAGSWPRTPGVELKP